MNQGIAGSKITVTDLRNSFEFYRDVIGFREVESRVMPKPDWTPDIVGTQVALNFSGAISDPFLCLVKQAKPAPAEDEAQKTVIVIRVPDVRSTVARAEAAGSPPTTDLIENSGMLFSFLQDPDGHTLEIYEATDWPPLE